MFRNLALPPTRGTPGWLLQLAYTTLRLFGQNGLQNHAAAPGCRPNAGEAGGLSGAPVRAASTRVIRSLAHHLKNEVPIIGVGGILFGSDAQGKIAAGGAL